jgi:hypothetical protein
MIQTIPRRDKYERIDQMDRPLQFSFIIDSQSLSDSKPASGKSLYPAFCCKRCNEHTGNTGKIHAKHIPLDKRLYGRSILPCSFFLRIGMHLVNRMIAYWLSYRPSNFTL